MGELPAISSESLAQPGGDAVRPQAGPGMQGEISLASRPVHGHSFAAAVEEGRK